MNRNSKSVHGCTLGMSMDGRGIKQKQVLRFAKLVAKLSTRMYSAWRCVRDWRGTPEACSEAERRNGAIA